MSDVVDQPIVDAGDMGAEDVSSDVDTSVEDSGESIEAEGEQAIDAAEAAGDISKSEAKELKKRLKLKVDGEEIEEEIDWNDEESIKRHLQKSRAFDKRVKEFSSYKAQVEQVLNRLQNDPEGLLEELGIDVDSLSENRLAKKIEELKKTPEQIEAEKMRKELEDYKKREKELQEKAQKAELERLKNEQAAQIELEITEALDSVNSILPKKNPAVMQRIAQTMLLAMQRGFTNVTPKDVIPLVEKHYKEEFSALLGSAPDEVLEALATKERLNNYRKNQVQKKVSSVQKPNIQDTGHKKKAKVEETPEPTRLKDFFKIT